MFKKILLFLYGFYIIYLPNLVSISPILSIAIVSSFLCSINIIFLNRKLFRWLRVVKIFPVFAIYLLLIIYIVVLGLYNNTFTFDNFTSELLFIIYIINIISLLIYFRKIYGDSTSLFDYLIKIGLVQSIIIFLMLIIPSFKDLAVLLYSEGDVLAENLMALTGYRIYGIGSAYTFTLPLIQGFLSLIALFKFDETYEYKYIFYSIVLIISSVFNARTSIFIYILIVGLYLLQYLFNKINKRVLFLMIFLIVVLPLFIVSISNVQGEAISWIARGFTELTSFIFQDNATGNVAVLIQDHLFFPEGWLLIFGLGFTISGQRGRSMIGKSSDIGYVNHIYKGGIIYTLTMYISHLVYLWKGIDGKFQRTTILIFLLIANYKGEILVNNMILVLSYLIVFNTRTRGLIQSK
ncbi:hypothetical protein CJ191_01940 [Aerococcus viridans]|uniref:Lipid A core - O-antigen ligase and related enzymes n=1 Tax=Aerococcus viridans TaxID=1377 RepID=A0A2N6UFM8_9LACT|nr:hypothetical protein [Aerococcus viridans]PMC80345.1 hypothetical protein CJ191_01940 [Aerococcus viridans]